MNDPTSLDELPGHEGHIELSEPENLGAPEAVGRLRTQFVRYPGCQQLVLWLPSSGWVGYTTLRVRTDAGLVLVDRPVRDAVGGQIQILLDTYHWPPGSLVLCIEHEDGWCHRLRMDKSHDPRPIELPRSQALADPREDLAFRDQALEALSDRLSRHLLDEPKGRGGQLIYVEGRLRLAFDYEFGIDAALIFVPTPAQWEAATGLSSDRRGDILAFVETEVLRRAPRGWVIRREPGCMVVAARRRD